MSTALPTMMSYCIADGFDETKYNITDLVLKGKIQNIVEAMVKIVNSPHSKSNISCKPACAFITYEGVKYQICLCPPPIVV